MPGRTFAYTALLAGSLALPQNFVLDMGDNGGAALEANPAQLLNTADQAFDWPAKLYTASPTATASARIHTSASSLSATATANCTAFTSCLPTTTIIITLYNPTPTLEVDPSGSGKVDTLTDTEDATPFDTAAPEPLSRWPHWFTAATFSLVFYDVLTVAVFLWLWVFGYLWWFRQGSDMGRTTMRRGMGDVEMARMDMPARHGVRRYERDCARSVRGYARARTESEQRARNAREAELEAEMRRLGMI